MQTPNDYLFDQVSKVADQQINSFSQRLITTIGELAEQTLSTAVETVVTSMGAVAFSMAAQAGYLAGSSATSKQHLDELCDALARHTKGSAIANFERTKGRAGLELAAQLEAEVRAGEITREHAVAELRSSGIPVDGKL